MLPRQLELIGSWHHCLLRQLR